MSGQCAGQAAETPDKIMREFLNELDQRLSMLEHPRGTGRTPWVLPFGDAGQLHISSDH
jgi:hypothetical protein